MVVLADSTAYNASTIDLLRSTIVDVTSSSLWQGVNGVYDSHDTGGHYIIRALASLYERNKTSSDLREYIKEYIGVQYNSVIEQARSSSVSNIYGSPWTGPAGTSFDGVAQTLALTVLISAIQLVDNPTSSASESLSTQSSTQSVSSAKKEFAGIIAGSVVGGITLVAALIVGAIFLCKLHRRRNGTPLVVDGSLPMLTPFTAQYMSSPGILGEQHPRNQAKSARFSAVAAGRDPSPLGAPENGNHVASTDNPPPGGRREHTLMKELLRSLNEWMSRDRWNAEEMPPGYHDD
ncbi:hypothetical protein IW262DRAFT_215243 [Armillaria fumosa]|nr:hypothetical protein IW262DRAFT_215243 [Armillaria fumosa]